MRKQGLNLEIKNKVYHGSAWKGFWLKTDINECWLLEIHCECKYFLIDYNYAKEWLKNQMVRRECLENIENSEREREKESVEKIKNIFIKKIS